MVILNNVANFWSSLSFKGNINKMRKCLLSYLKNEGIKCEIKDGWIIFEFNDSIYEVIFLVGSKCAECVIAFEIYDEAYEKLEQNDKTFIADKVNTELENHAPVYAYNDSLKVRSAFYFTSKAIMLNLFIKHFEELNQSVELAIDIIKDKIESASIEETKRPKQIGFCIPEVTLDTNNVAAINN